MRRLFKSLVTPGEAGHYWHMPVDLLWQGLVGEPAQSDEPAQMQTMPLPDTPVEVTRLITASTPDVQRFNEARVAQGYPLLNLTRADLSRRDLKSVDFKNCLLLGADLRHSDLRGARFEDAIIRGVKIAGATLSDDTFQNHDLEAFVDGQEVLSFQHWLRNARPDTIRSIVSVTDVRVPRSRRRKQGEWEIVVRSNVRAPLSLKLWMATGGEAKMVEHFVLEANASHRCPLRYDAKALPASAKITLSLFVDGLGPCLREWELPRLS